MEKKRRITVSLKVIVVISVSLACILPGTSMVTTIESRADTVHRMLNMDVSENMMMVENTSGKTGDTGQVIHINGTWNIDLASYCMALYYDATKIKIVNLNLQGTVADYEGSGWNIYWSYDESVTPSYITAVAITFSSNYILKGSGILFNVVVNIKANAPIGNTVLDLADNVGPAHISCVFIRSNATSIYPELVDGNLIIQSNNPPNAPILLNPPNHAVGVSVDTNLSWNASVDPDVGDIVTYDVYFGTTNPPPKISPGNQSGTTYDPGTMNYNTKYYWKIVAWDNHSAFNASPLWDFTTETAPQPPKPDLDCQGTLNWTSPKIKPGATVTGSFAVKNIGQAASKLNWEVKSWPSWGTWTFYPSSGTNLTPGASVIGQVTVVAPSDKNKAFTGEVKLVNKNNSSDFVILQVSLVTPKNKSLVLNFLEWLLERFPVLHHWLFSFYNR